MKLRGIEFGNVLGASGVQGFFGEGYWMHRVPMRKPDFSGMTFVSKTVTLLSRKGNMNLTSRQTPKYPFPRCIRVKFFNDSILNAVGLSNFGLGYLLGDGRLQKRTKPFMISIMSLVDTPKRRLEELRIMADMIGFCKESFSAPFGVQINLSCPNTGHNPADLIGESADALDVLGILGVPLMPKYSIVSAPISAIMKLNDHPSCDAICVSNTIPFGWEGIGERVWGTKISPLARLGGGGLSGKFLRPLVCEWIARLRDAGFTRPVNGGGGILSTGDVRCYIDAGVSSVFFGIDCSFVSTASEANN